MIDNRQHQRIAKVLSFWNALTRFDGAGDHPCDEYARLTSAIQYVEFGSAAVGAMAKAVEVRRTRVHPRIQLLPFLQGDKALATFAERVLKKVQPSETTGTGHPKFKFLNKEEAKTILQLSTVQLATAIQAGFINWPTGGRRTQKISALQIEMALLDSALTKFQRRSRTRFLKNFHTDDTKLVGA